MTNKKSTKKALLLSVLSLLLCCSMLIGTTFAWFTDSVESGLNRITAGNLDVELYHSNKVDTDEEVTSSTTLFDDIKLWEPGAMVWEKLTVKNVGTLALKYTLNVNATNFTPVGGPTLADVLKVAVLDTVPTRDSIKAATLAPLSSFVLATNQWLEGTEDRDVYCDSDTFYVAIYWEPTDHDNDYNVPGGALSVDLGVNLVATQYTLEEDSFDSRYDVVDVVNGSQEMTLTANEAPSKNTKETTITVPANAFNDGDEVSIAVNTENSLFNISAASTDVVASLDVVLSVNGVQTEEELTGGKTYTVVTYISTGLTDVTVTYTGTDGRSQPTNVQYDPATGKLTFETTHFSEYEVTAKAVAIDVAKDAAYANGQAVVEALKAEDAVVEVSNSLSTYDRIELGEALKEAEDLHEDAKVTVGDVQYDAADLQEKVENNEVVLVDIPVALIEELENKTVKTKDNGTIDLDCAYSFLPTQTEEECLAGEFGMWHADFVISVDKDVEETGEIGLAGYYSAWCETIDHKWLAIPMDGIQLTAGEEYRLVAGMLQEATINYSEICKYAIREENLINGFLCGAYADETMSGVTLNVELRLYEVSGKGDCAIGGGCNHPKIDCETGNYYVIGAYSYTFE